MKGRKKLEGELKAFNTNSKGFPRSLHRCSIQYFPLNCTRIDSVFLYWDYGSCSFVYAESINGILDTSKWMTVFGIKKSVTQTRHSGKFYAE